jgi:hypothetical protein
VGRILATAATCAALLIASASVAFADPGRGGPGANPPMQPGGAAQAGIGGQIYVDGAGTVRVAGNFLAFGDVGGMEVTVTDRAGDARAIIDGKRVLQPRPRSTRRAARPRTAVLRPSARQMVTIEGRDVVATFRGDGNVTLSITGAGSVKLDGVGTFRVNNRAAESWPLRPITLPLRPTPRQDQR